jgi:gliding motility-associated-like protein
VFDLDKNNSTKALGNDYNGDTLCINDNRFAICDSDVSLNIAGLIDSVVIQSATPGFDNYIFQTTYNSTTAQIKGQNTKKLIITDKTQNDTTELKKILLTINGILPPNIKPPTEFRISVKIYQGGCEIEAICYIRSYIRVTIGKPRDTILCHNNKPLNLFELLSGNDVTIGTWTPKLSTGTTFFDPKIDKPGVFTYELKGAKGCPSDSVKVKIGVVTVPSINLGKDTIICEDSTLTLNVPFTFEKYLWQDGSTRPDYRVSQAGTYHVVASTSGCISSDTITFRGINCRKCKFYAPNAFTPDANGTNDDFRLYSDCIPSVYKLQIYNRWGDLMFETTDFNEGWDGVFKGRAQLQGIYVYLVEIQTDYIEKPFYEKKKGDFMLMR